MSTYLFIINLKTDDNYYIKVGYSEENPHNPNCRNFRGRIRSLQTGNPFEIRAVGYWDDEMRTKELEKQKLILISPDCYGLLPAKDWFLVSQNKLIELYNSLDYRFFLSAEELFKSHYCCYYQIYTIGIKNINQIFRNKYGYNKEYEFNQKLDIICKELEGYDRYEKINKEYNQLYKKLEERSKKLNIVYKNLHELKQKYKKLDKYNNRLLEENEALRRELTQLKNNKN